MTSVEFSRLSHDERQIVNDFTSEIPVKLGAMADALGVSSVKLTNLPTGVSGQITSEDGGFHIRINRNEARERQRFTLAHEMAHFLLHRSVIENSPGGITDNVLYRSGAPERIEFEANRLAADLVMPACIVEKVLKDRFKGIVAEATIESMAASFQVSKSAMEIRLSNLVLA
ncbi:ImmA/IrrE family metallo-endopeptidase [Hyphomonas chukchiensis]|uniref:IrrE N-terminal-like domain-containing protein n=1 Tax=Hyphomonas chukchiensis TaxID=1280947 RepID=A0A062ULY8_9PROT|nr:ImmA/IrrE family metallo-endopeptidase [Hyphomonas chukchiensis]KCZ57589.1 hypothetical protein HY30_05280 [Hyphomonas chukchiensis]